MEASGVLARVWFQVEVPGARPQPWLLTGALQVLVQPQTRPKAWPPDPKAQALPQGWPRVVDLKDLSLTQPQVVVKQSRRTETEKVLQSG